MGEDRQDILSRVTAKPDLEGDPRDFLPRAKHSGFQLGSLGQTVDVWLAMLRDPECVVYLGVAGAVVPAGFGPLLGQLVRRGLVDVIYSTGAQVYHDLYEAVHGDHYKLLGDVSDTQLGRMNIDRIYDVVADDIGYQKFDERLSRLLDGLPESVYTTQGFIRAVASVLKEETRSRDGMVMSALETRTPIFIPTLHDSSLAFALVIRRHREGRTPVRIDYTEDLHEQYRLFKTAPRTGGIYIGGGVPKNHIQQLHPLRQVVEGYFGHEEGAGHDYGIQFTADQPVWGGLSGCTMEESESWGKYHRRAPRAVCYGDATINFYLSACTVFKAMRAEGIERKPRGLVDVIETENGS